MEKKSIAILFECNIDKIRGEFTAIHNRVKELSKYDGITVDVYVFGRYYGNFVQKIKGLNQTARKECIYIEGIRYNCLWYKKSIRDHIVNRLFKRNLGIVRKRFESFTDRFIGYDLVYANSLYTALIGLKIKQITNKPLICMWHGSSIHTHPFNNKSIMQWTKEVLENADMNLFVSDELLKTAKGFTNKLKGAISYNGIDTGKFYHLTDEERYILRMKKGIAKEEKCVAFIGNCQPIKNIQYLPILFSKIAKEIENIRFFIIGKGEFAPYFENSKENITFVNEVKNEDMPEWYNMMDLIVMPSINEGLPMTCLEATACGTPFVGSRVGAIADIVGLENTIVHGDNFNYDFPALCIKRLKDGKSSTLPSKVLLKDIVEKEIKIIERLIK